jgi:hypothetical protein
MYWIGATPTPSGGYINRKKEFEEHCAYWSLSVNCQLIGTTLKFKNKL